MVPSQLKSVEMNAQTLHLHQLFLSFYFEWDSGNDLCDKTTMRDVASSLLVEYISIARKLKIVINLVHITHLRLLWLKCKWKNKVHDMWENTSGVQQKSSLFYLFHVSIFFMQQCVTNFNQTRWNLFRSTRLSKEN